MRHYHHNTSDIIGVFSILEWVAEQFNCQLIEPHTAWTSWNAKPQYPAELSTHYGEWDNVTDATPIDPSRVFIIPPSCGGSDYSGDLVEVANHKAIIDMMPSEYQDGSEYLSYSGGHGTFDVAIRLDALTPELMETIEALQDYPIIDESLWSQLESQSQNEAWESSIRSDFRKVLGAFMWSTYESSTKAEQREDECSLHYTERMERVEAYLSDECGEISDSDLAELCWKMADLANVYWTNEQGSDSWLEIEDVINGSIGSKRRKGDYQDKAYAEIKSLIQASMSDRKYELGIIRFVDRNQLSLPGVN